MALMPSIYTDWGIQKGDRKEDGKKAKRESKEEKGKGEKGKQKLINL